MRHLLLLVLVLSFACKRQPPLNERVRARIVSKIPAASVAVRDAATLDVALGDEKMTLSLDNLMVICESQPDRCDEAIDRLVDNVASVAQAPKGVRPEELRVTLYSRTTIDDYQRALAAKSPDGGEAERLVTFPFHADLLAVLVRDLPSGIALMTRTELGKLDLDDQRARTVAAANMEKGLPSLTTEPAAPGVFQVRAGDSYEAARILLPKLWDALSKQVDGDLLVVAPTRDVVFAAGSKDAKGVAAMNALAKKAFDAGPYALSVTVLRRTDAGFVPAPASQR